MDYFEYFEKKRAGLLSPEEEKTFHERLAKDNEFKEAYESYESMEAFLEAKPEIDHGKDEIKALRKQHEKRGRKRSVRLLIIVLCVAAISALVLFTLIPKSSEKSGHELYAEFFQPASIDLNTRSGSINENDNLKLAIQAYENANYEKAYTNLDTTGVNKEDQPLILLARGISGVNSTRLSEGRQILEELKTNQPVLKNDVNWYLALSYLKEDRPSLAKSYLQHIPENSNYYERVQMILRQTED